MRARRARPGVPGGVAVVALVLAGGCGPGVPGLVRRPATPPPAVLIANVSVLDVETLALARDRDVLIVGDRIVTVAPIGRTAAPAGAQTIDGRGATALPGLIDLHGHVGNSSTPPWQLELPDAERTLRAYLYCGVTTVLDPGDLATQAFTRRDAVAAGALLGPRILTAGPMVTAVGGHPVALLERLAPWWIRWYLIPRATREVETLDAARTTAREIAALGADFLKLTVDRIPEQAPRIRRDLLAAVVAEATRHGLRAIAHIGTAEDAIDAAEAGVAAWAHGVYKERLADAQVVRLAGFGIPMVATIGVFEAYALLGQGPRRSTPLERETVDATTLAAFDTVPDTAATALFRPYLDTLRPLRSAWRDNVRRLRAAGATILAGSDTQSGVFPGAGLHRELGFLTEAGLTPGEAIRAATLDAARFLAAGRAPDVGILAEGKRADVLLVEGDPTTDLDALSRIRAVIAGGVPLERTPIGG